MKNSNEDGTKKYHVNDILAFLGKNHKIIGSSSDAYFKNLKPSEKIDEESLDWVNTNNNNKEDYINQSRAKIIIADLSINKEKINPDKVVILVENPNLVFARIANNLFVKKPEWHIHPTAIIDTKTVINEPVYIGEYAVIKCKEIGPNCIIGAHVYIGENVTIGSSTRIFSGASIGNEGFGFVKNEKGEFEKFPQIGSVFIGDNVEIGANSCIDRGSLSDTKIKDGVKINNLVHIAHNVVIGKNCFIGAGVYLGGSVSIGFSSWIAPKVSIRDHLKIGNNVMVGLGAVVTQNIQNNEMWYGVPAKRHKITGEVYTT